jgi:hypothetical protein
MNTHNEDGDKFNGKYSQENEVGSKLMRESLKRIYLLSQLKEGHRQKQ